MKRKGIILAGGKGTRLHPSTLVTSKQLLPVYDKPMIYYPLSTLMLADIREILIICTPSDIHLFKKLLGEGKQYGLQIEYAAQPSPKGLAEALIIGESFLDHSPSCLILGDNIFYGNAFQNTLSAAHSILDGATIFAYNVRDPHEYGIVQINEKYSNIISLEEKPKNPKSNLAVTGLYFYDEHAPSYAKNLAPSDRGELEITDLNKVYLAKGQLNYKILGRGNTWIDTGTPENLLDAQIFIHNIQKRQGLIVSCIEEIAYRKNWISVFELEELSLKYNNKYGLYLRSLMDNDH